MSRLLSVHFLPDLTTPEELAGGIVVVIDVLRASTTIAHALAAGARAVIPCLEIDDAKAVAARLPPGQTVSGGERRGLPIEGFTVGNSPRDYTPTLVGGKTVAFTTTNGTKAMMQCRQAARVLVGSFVNLKAVCHTLARCTQPIHLLCAGTGGRITREDVHLAGSIALQMTRVLELAGSPPLEFNDQALLAVLADRVQCGVLSLTGDVDLAKRELIPVLYDTQGGRNLKAIGLDRDIEQAAEVDRFDFVPELNLAAWQIEIAR